ncbi:MAG: CusA/CzcA family heavy metal efflux RND transporter [Micavibrio aeruginosavorus]|jgi:cobalt-zinc-cadmium resistance protein CzcA|uniref:CusA/CzcA family heavy metal efflux RND transporter n=1 Tax=Micavibrio aeruginosavorus TaxID=349221 RepID=A0A2W5MXF9_9BACT|nr:MAG: CusA/CzcA family heavy metal efflux RND transporter [Azospirillum brasilense]PZQ45961.1 MAG: CusA/CzcA family heavy metal efflux RND transporter [Micavibrio aeruginosavorus]
MIERILQFSLHHRFLIALLTAAVAAFGVYSLKNLPIDAVPDITNNQVQINSVAPAFSPMEVEKQVTFPVETALAGIPGLEYTRSISRNGFSQVTAVFNDNVDIYFARAQVNERIAEARESLPDGVEPRMGAISTGLGEIYMWTVEYANPRGKGAEIKNGHAGWQSDGSYLTPEGQRLNNELEQASYLRTVQDWIIRPQLKGVKGVAGVDAIGGYVKQYHVQPDPQKLVALGLSFGDVVNALERNNISIGAGYIERRGEAYVVRSDGRIENADQIGKIVIANRGGFVIYLRDIASVGIGKELRTGSASENGEEVVVGTALMLIGENSRTVSKAVDQKITEINKSLPEGIKAKTVLNRTKLVDRTISTVQKNLAEGALLVIVILFALLGNFRAALITALVIPLSMLMTSMGMIRAGISGNLMSLGALDFGLIVDGAVIITENCLSRLAHRQHQEGRMLTVKERLHEVMVASREMIQPSVFGQAIIIMVYIPLLTFTGVEGKMFEPMALTVIFALAAAFVLSLTFVPAMLAIFVTGKVEEKESRVIHKTKGWYAPALNYALNAPMKVIAIATAGFAFSLVLFSTMGQEFIPTLDEKDIAMHAMRIPSTGITQSQDMQFAVEKAVSTVPEVAFAYAKTGTAEMAADPMPPNVSDTFIILKDKEEWPDPSISKSEIIEKITEAVSDVPGNNYEFTQPIQMRFNELISGVRSDVAVKVYGDDFPAMEKTAAELVQVLKGIDGAADVKMEQTSGLPMLEVKLDKDAIARYGLNVADVLDVLSIAVGGREAGLVFQGDRRFDIVVRLPDKMRQNLNVLQNLPILLPADNDTTAQSGLPDSRPVYIPLKQVAKLEITDGPNQISRENGKRRVVVQSNVRGRDIGSFVKDAQAAIDTQVKLPAGYWLEWGGQFKNLQEAKARLAVVVPACFFMIFLLLFTALGSVKQALLVFSGVPLALTGGIITLWLRGMPFSISAAVGLIALSGVAVLNGLVMITRINQLVREGLESHRAIVDGALSRFRPVLMTALVASLGFVPMAIASGAGAEVQKPLATVVIGGLITATVLTLLVLPAIYKRFNLARDVLAKEEL